jgi:hypothetical protein
MLLWLAMNLSTSYKQQNESNHTGTSANKARSRGSHSTLDLVRRARFDSDLYSARVQLGSLLPVLLM